MRAIHLSLMAILSTTATAHGSILCQKKSGVVVVRTACKKKESPLNLAALGSGSARSGSINADGTPQYVSPGVTVQRTSAGNYQIDFPAGTWPSTGFVTVFSPLGASLTGELHQLNGDGSTTVSVAFSSDAIFLFVAVGT